MSHSQFQRPRRAPCGFTLVEVLVSSAVLVIVLGMALGISMETSQATDQITRRQEAIQYSQQVIEQVSDLLRTAVPPGELAGVRDTEPIRPVFTATKLSVPTYVHSPGSYLCMATIQNAHTGDGDEARSTVTGVLDPVLETVTDEVPQKRTDWLRSLPLEKMSATIEFAYGAPSAPGQPVEYQPEWTAAGLPPLVQILVTVQPHDPKSAAISLQTAVIPGMRSGMAVAAADMATTAPAPIALTTAGDSNTTAPLSEPEAAP